MKQIEFFGLPGSGKTLLKEKLLDKLSKENMNNYSYKGVIKEFLPSYEKNWLNFILLKIFFYFRSSKKKISYNKKNLKSTLYNKESLLINIKKYVFKIYEKNIDKIFVKFEKKSFAQVSIYLIKNSNFSNDNKLIFKRWLKEELVANYLIYKNKKKINYIIDSEGFIQRLFIYLYKKNDKQKIIRSYLKYCPIPYTLIVMKKKIFKKKKSLNKEFSMNTQESLKNYSLINKALTKDKRVKIIYNKDLIKSKFNIF